MPFCNITVSLPEPPGLSVGLALSCNPGPSRVMLCGWVPAFWIMNVYMPALNAWTDMLIEYSFSVTITVVPVTGADDELVDAELGDDVSGELATVETDDATDVADDAAEDGAGAGEVPDLLLLLQPVTTSPMRIRPSPPLMITTTS